MNYLRAGPSNVNVHSGLANQKHVIEFYVKGSTAQSEDLRNRDRCVNRGRNFSAQPGTGEGRSNPEEELNASQEEIESSPIQQRC